MREKCEKLKVDRSATGGLKKGSLWPHIPVTYVLGPPKGQRIHLISTRVKHVSDLTENVLILVVLKQTNLYINIYSLY